MFKEQHGKCHYCGVRMHILTSKQAKKAGMLDTMATYDHIVPDAHGGNYSRSNCVIACHHCNTTRGTMDYELFKSIRKSPYWQEHVEKWRKRNAYKHETINRIKKFRPFVYI